MQIFLSLKVGVPCGFGLFYIILWKLYGLLKEKFCN